MTRHAILSKPQWQPHAASPILLALPLGELRALDSLVDFIHEQGCSTLSESDCRVWARMSGGLGTVEAAIAAMIKTDGPEAPPLVPLRAAQASLSACASFAGISKVPLRTYTRSISLAPDELPPAWQEHLAHIRDRRDDGQIKLAPDLYERMTRKLCQYAWYLRERGLPMAFDLPGLRAFYAYETTRISARGAPLRPATLSATFTDLRDFLRFSRAFSEPLIDELDKLLKKLRDRAEVQTAQKFSALAGIDITTILPRAEEILAQLGRQSNPARRHIQRNRALALAIPPMTPLRREWHELAFGRDVVWSDGRYRMRDYKLRKTRHLLGREAYPGSIHPSVQHFVDARLLQDDDPKYLPALRARAEEQHWRLFLHPNGTEVAANYVSQVWSTELGTGAHICRSIVYDVLFAISEDATLGGTLLNDHTSHQARKKYTGDRAKAAAMAAASHELDGILAAFGAGP
ncbi:hypothetical protein PVT71_28655 (plasmid) [Salipiger sp. H15]|uniref:Integrase n=1 Tax=Alloyangia sp. H15 TaxID=3029062 RepID=A0AAU8AU02_9RHOB